MSRFIKGDCLLDLALTFGALMSRDQPILPQTLVWNATLESATWSLRIWIRLMLLDQSLSQS